MRLPYAAYRGEGENACVIGRNEEVLAEFPYGSPEDQWHLATKFAELLNEINANHVCSERARSYRAELLLRIVVANQLRDHDTIAFLSETIDDATIKGVKQQIDDISGPEVPF